MMQQAFAEKTAALLQDDPSVIGLAVAGSWLTHELDAYSDLDLIVVTQEKISGSKAAMLAYAQRFGDLLSGFTGEHVGEPRVLICLYDNPLLHVDIKFLTLDEFGERVETPVILLDKDAQLQTVLNQTEAHWPYPDYQWIEDRFWIWVHYALLKIGRGEYVEAFDFLGYLRMMVLGPMLHIKNGNLPRGVRKVETQLPPADFAQLRATIPTYEKRALLHALQQAVVLYRQLRAALFTPSILLQTRTEEKVMQYFDTISGNQ